MWFIKRKEEKKQLNFSSESCFELTVVVQVAWGIHQHVDIWVSSSSTNDWLGLIDNRSSLSWLGCRANSSFKLEVSTTKASIIMSDQFEPKQFKILLICYIWKGTAFLQSKSFVIAKVYPLSFMLLPSSFCFSLNLPLPLSPSLFSCLGWRIQTCTLCQDGAIRGMKKHNET